LIKLDWIGEVAGTLILTDSLKDRKMLSGRQRKPCKGWEKMVLGGRQGRRLRVVQRVLEQQVGLLNTWLNSRPQDFSSA
jgi:hypothetical protein